MGREVTHFCEHPQDPNIVVVGGFNGKLKYYDIRQFGTTSKPSVVNESNKLIDGGLWRVVPKNIDGRGYFAIATCSENSFLVVDAADCRFLSSTS